MTTLTEGPRNGEFIVSEASGMRSRDAITLTGSSELDAGTVLGKVETGVPTATAGTPVGGTVGNGTISSVSADAGAMEGTWHVEMTGTGATAAFKVIRPDGTLATPATGAVGTAYNGTRGINATIADGANDWTAGDIIPIIVAYKDGDSIPKYEILDTAGTDGSEIAAGVLYATKTPTAGGVDAVGVVRDAEINLDLLTWPAGVTADQKAVALGQLAKLGIIARS
jgi:hypothetical protein